MAPNDKSGEETKLIYHVGFDTTDLTPEQKAFVDEQLKATLTRIKLKLKDKVLFHDFNYNKVHPGGDDK
ncbi:MAG: hypothetical protein ACJ71U_15520 [Terriglobales bacterium]